MTKQVRVQIETKHHEDRSFTHELAFANGQKRVVSVAPDHELFTKFAAYGAKAKLLAAANAGGDSDDACKRIDALVDAFDEGKFNLVGEGGPKYTPLVQALAELKGISVEEADKLVKGMSKSTQAKLRATERVASIIARIKAADAKEEDSGDALLDGLLTEPEHAAKRSA